MRQDVLFDKPAMEVAPALETLWSLWQQTPEPIRLKFLDRLRRAYLSRPRPNIEPTETLRHPQRRFTVRDGKSKTA